MVIETKLLDFAFGRDSEAYLSYARLQTSRSPIISACCYGSLIAYTGILSLPISSNVCFTELAEISDRETIDLSLGTYLVGRQNPC